MQKFFLCWFAAGWTVESSNLISSRFGQIWSAEYPDWQFNNMTNICKSTKWNSKSSPYPLVIFHHFTLQPADACLNTSTKFQFVIDKWTQTVDFIVKKSLFRQTLPKKTSTDKNFSFLYLSQRDMKSRHTTKKKTENISNDEWNLSIFKQNSNITYKAHQ